MDLYSIELDFELNRARIKWVVKQTDFIYSPITESHIPLIYICDFNSNDRLVIIHFDSCGKD